MTRKHLTVAELAAEMNVSQDIARSLIESGSIKAYDAAYGRRKKRWRIKPEWLEEFVHMRSNVPSSQSPATPTRRQRKAEAPTYY